MANHILDNVRDMAVFSTRQAAKMLGVSSSTLSNYIKVGKVPAPKTVVIGKLLVHSWTATEIERVRKLLPNIQDGRTTRHQKQTRMSSKTTS